jgi:hypothetical protein
MRGLWKADDRSLDRGDAAAGSRWGLLLFTQRDLDPVATIRKIDLMPIIWDFRVGKEHEPSRPRATLPDGAVPKRFVWCAQFGKEVFSGECECYFANNYYFKGEKLCPVSKDGRTFRDQRD